MLKRFTIQRLCCYRHATNYGCFSAIKCNELRLLMRHRAVRKDTHAGPQRILPAAVSSCRQRRATRFYGCRMLGLNDIRTKEILGLKA